MQGQAYTYKLRDRTVVRTDPTWFPSPPPAAAEVEIQQEEPETEFPADQNFDSGSEQELEQEAKQEEGVLVGLWSTPAAVTPPAAVGLSSAVGRQFGFTTVSTGVGGSPLATVDMEATHQPSSRTKFSGRSGTITLKEFRMWHGAMAAEFTLKHGGNYTPQVAFQQLGQYLTEEAADLYEQHYENLLRPLMVANPAYLRAISDAQAAELQARIAAHTAGEGAGPAPTTVELTAAQLMQATQGIDPQLQQGFAFPDPVGTFFGILQLQFPPKNAEKIRELVNFEQKPGENLLMMYRRIQKLQADTKALTEGDTAVKFMNVLQRHDPHLHAQVVFQVFSLYGESYTLTQVYEVANRLELANVYYSAVTERNQTPNKKLGGIPLGHLAGQVGQVQAARPVAASNRAVASTSAGPSTGRGTKMAAAGVAEKTCKCHRCGATDHYLNSCPHARESLLCQTCNRPGHLDIVCYQTHPELQKNFQRVNAGQPSGAGRVAGQAPAVVPAVTPASQGTPKVNKFKAAREKRKEQMEGMKAELQALQAQLTALKTAQPANTAVALAPAPVPARAGLDTNAGAIVPAGFPYGAYAAQEGAGGARRMTSEWEADMPASVAQTRRAARVAAGLEEPRLQLPQGEPVASERVSTMVDGRPPSGLASETTNPARWRSSVPMSFRPVSPQEEEELAEVSPILRARYQLKHGVPPGFRHEAGVERPKEGSPSTQVPTVPSTGPEFAGTSSPAFNTSGRSTGKMQSEENNASARALGAQWLYSTQIVDKLLDVPVISCREMGLTLADLIKAMEAKQGREGSSMPTNAEPAVSVPELHVLTAAPGQADGVHPMETCEEIPLVPIHSRRRPLEMSRHAQMSDYACTAVAEHEQVFEEQLKWASHSTRALHELTTGRPMVAPEDRLTVRLNAALLDNKLQVVTISGQAPKVVLMDTGAQPVIIGRRLAEQLKLEGEALRPSPWQIRTAGGKVEEVKGETSKFMDIKFRQGTPDECVLQLRCLVTDAESYDLLMGQEALFPPGVSIDNWTELAAYRPGWKQGDNRLAYLPLDLHGIRSLPSTALAVREVFCTMPGSDQVLTEHEQSAGMPARQLLGQTLQGVRVDNQLGAVLVNGVAPGAVVLDTAAEAVILGAGLFNALGLDDTHLQPAPRTVCTGGGHMDQLRGALVEPATFIFNRGTNEEMVLTLRCLVSSSDQFDVLLGMQALYPSGFVIDNWTMQALYRVDWQTTGKHLGCLPLALFRNATQLDKHKDVFMAAYIPSRAMQELEETMLESEGGDTDQGEHLPQVAAVQYQACTTATLGQARKTLQAVMDNLQSLSTSTHETPTPLLHTHASWTPAADGIILVELFGGMASGLEACLRSGFVVKRYIYCDVDPTARRVAINRIMQLQADYPTQFAKEAWDKAFTSLPQDVRLIQPAHLRALGRVDLLVSGWECQGFSAAGRGQGLGDSRSTLFLELIQIMKWMQETSPGYMYILENTPAQLDRREAVRKDAAIVQHFLGTPLLIDAVQCGSHAHRLRNFWSNIAPVTILEMALLQTKRDTTTVVADILDPGRKPREVTKTEQLPWYPVNVPGEPRKALPTLVSYPGSHAYKDQGPGMIFDMQQRTWEEPRAVERERAMGFRARTTECLNVTERQRREVLGRAMDMNCLVWVLSMCMTFQMFFQPHAMAVTTTPGSAGTDIRLPPLDAVHLATTSLYGPGGHVYQFHLEPGGGEVPLALELPIFDVHFSGQQGMARQSFVHTASSMASPRIPDMVHPEATLAARAAAHKWTIGAQLSSHQAGQLRDLIVRNSDVFAFSMGDLRRCNVLKFRIALTKEEPLWKRRHRLSQHEWQLVDERCQELYAAGLIRPSNSSFAAATVMPAKKDSSGMWTEKRMCGDYRPLNAVTPQDRYPMPVPEDIFDSIGKSKLFSILDLRQGFNQIAIAEEDCHKTAFHASNQLWEWLVMPFGLKNAPVTFQRVMDIVLSGANHCRCFIDDVLVHSEDFESHLQHLQDLFNRLRKTNLRCHPGKCEFGVASVVYLGHRIVPDGIMADQAKIDAILQIKPPKDVAQLRAYLGLTNYYRVYVPDHSRIAKPLNDLLKKEVPWVWTAAAQEAFEELKRRLCEQPVLRRPDYERPFLLHTDWSSLGIGAVLAQVDDDGHEYVVAYASRSNNRAESNYSSYEGECLAVVWSVVHFRPYLYGRRFTLYTDHQPLNWLMTNDKLSGKLARWALILQEYEFDLVHRAGVTHQNADALSRSPLDSSEDLTAARQDYDDLSSTTAGFVSLLANVQAAEVTAADVWHDAAVLEYLKHQVYPPHADLRMKDRIQQRAKRYAWENGHLVRLLPQGKRVVPPPHERAALIDRMHSDLGHFGVKRTYSLLVPHFYWRGMYTQVKEMVARCEQCDRVRVSFTAPQPQLHPLPIYGLFYRWSCDLAGELPVTSRGNRYFMIMIEHFSKWVEVVALPDKTARSTSQAFLQCVLSRFGACAECLTDQGAEFRGEFQDLLDFALIDHRRTSREHPQADGLAERMVQTSKKGLRKICLTTYKKDWDLALPYIIMGYRMSKHASLSAFSPYELLFGRAPLPPSSIAATMMQVVDLDNPDVWAQVMAERAVLFQRMMPMAMNNLRIAQHRDTLRYAYTRGGSYLPKARKFAVGDYVYLQKQTMDTLDTAASRIILRVAQIKPSGVLVLQGSDGRLLSEHAKNCAPCHLPNLDPTVVTANWIPPRDYPCKVCHRTDDPEHMLLCDGCNGGFHLYCLQPPLDLVPPNTWYCSKCQPGPPALVPS